MILLLKYRHSTKLNNRHFIKQVSDGPIIVKELNTTTSCLTLPCYFMLMYAAARPAELNLLESRVQCKRKLQWSTNLLSVLHSLSLPNALKYYWIKHAQCQLTLYNAYASSTDIITMESGMIFYHNECLGALAIKRTEFCKVLPLIKVEISTLYILSKQFPLRWKC